jgi:hypothetical protein
VKTDCDQTQLAFQGLASRQVVGSFDAGQVTSDAGALLLCEVALRTKLVTKFAACFRDGRDQRYVEHSPETSTKLRSKRSRKLSRVSTISDVRLPLVCLRSIKSRLRSCRAVLNLGRSGFCSAKLCNTRFARATLRDGSHMYPLQPQNNQSAHKHTAEKDAHPQARCWRGGVLLDWLIHDRTG